MQDTGLARLEGGGKGLLKQHVLLDPGGVGRGALVGPVARPRAGLGAGGGHALHALLPLVALVISVVAGLALVL